MFNETKDPIARTGLSVVGEQKDGKKAEERQEYYKPHNE